MGGLCQLGKAGLTRLQTGGSRKHQEGKFRQKPNRLPVLKRLISRHQQLMVLARLTADTHGECSAAAQTGLRVNSAVILSTLLRAECWKGLSPSQR